MGGDGVRVHGVGKHGAGGVDCSISRIGVDGRNRHGALVCCADGVDGDVTRDWVDRGVGRFGWLGLQGGDGVGVCVPGIDRDGDGDGVNRDWLSRCSTGEHHGCHVAGVGVKWDGAATCLCGAVDGCDSGVTVGYNRTEDEGVIDVPCPVEPLQFVYSHVERSMVCGCCGEVSYLIALGLLDPGILLFCCIHLALLYLSFTPFILLLYSLSLLLSPHSQFVVVLLLDLRYGAV